CLENSYLDTDVDGKEIIIGTIIDMTQQKEAERAHLESEERFKVLSRVTAEGVIFLDGKVIVDSNDQFARIVGMRNGREVLGKPVTDFIHLYDYQRINSHIEISSTKSIEIRTTAIDGKPLFLDVYGSIVNRNGKDMNVLVINDFTLRKRAENALEQTVVRLRTLLEHSPNAIIILIDEKIRYANFSALTILGVQEEDELYDQDFDRFIAPSFRNEIMKDLRAVREGEDIEYKEIKILNNGGDEVDSGIKSTLTVYENKPSVQISLNNISARVQLVHEQMRIRIIEEINDVLKKEIKEHKITQQKLISQQNYTRNLIESSIDMILASDENGNITEFNHAAQKQFGYKQEEIIGKNTEILYADPEEVRMVRKTLAEKGEFVGEIRNIRKNGEIFTTLISASIIRDDLGKIIGSMGVSRDITVARENERKILEHKAKLESIFNSTENLMIWTMNREHQLTSNNVNFYNWVKESLDEEIVMGSVISKVLEDHIDIDLYQGQLLDSLTNAFRGRPQQVEFALKDKRSKTIWLQVFLNPVYLGEKLEEISCLAYDITDRKSIDRRILEAFKEKEVLLQEIHHRVKNNLQVISSILNLQSSYVNDQKIIEILQESQNRIKSISFIHETLYRTADFSKIDFSEYLRTLTNNLIQSYRLQDCRVSLEASLQELNMHIDQAIPCGLIVNELVSNALKYAFAGRKEGILSLELHSEKRKASLRIADNGIGMPQDFLNKKTDSLGIQLVYTLIEQLDGTIQVNTAPTGTEFLITFEMR
ncbi:MAG: PAS domain S-box protein, partial [Crocinitomicaceae bacterium]|nr:PAS domain S-box protein [Crocinitomicaceae bacterium]